MRTTVAILAIGLLLPAAVPAQTTTADGVAALVRGDFRQAVEVLKAAADQAKPDKTAEFFLALMYENGWGVPQDVEKACALYVRGEDGPFRRQAFRLEKTLFTEGSEDWAQRCATLSMVGIDSGLNSTALLLEPGLLVSFDLNGATITAEKETHVDFPIALPQAKYLPVVHTPLMTGTAEKGRQHFVEVLAWVPDETKSQWMLHWRLFEVVPDNLLFEGEADVAFVRASSPPSMDNSWMVRDLVSLRTNNEGNAEWTVINSEDKKSGIVMTTSQRKDLAERERVQREKVEKQALPNPESLTASPEPLPNPDSVPNAESLIPNP